MTSLFADLEELVSSAVDRFHGETTVIVRQQKGQYLARSADSSRPYLEVDGVVDRNPVTAKPQDEGAYDGFQPSIGGDRFHVSYNKRLFASRDEWPAQGDHIEIPSNPSIPPLKVVKTPEDDGIGRIVCICEKA